ncbi:hypothetical protein ACUR5C_01940 [Aliikangiella sp. IMCC44653]
MNNQFKKDSSEQPKTSRRTVLKGVLASSLVLLGGASAVQYWQNTQLNYMDAKSYRFLQEEDCLLLSVLTPIFAARAFSEQELTQVLTNIDQSILRLPKSTQHELRQLFDLLFSHLGKVLLLGIWANWQQASVTQIDRAFTQLKDSSLTLLQSAYNGLHQLIMGAVYAEQSSWRAINYPGPPQFNLA